MAEIQLRHPFRSTASSYIRQCTAPGLTWTRTIGATPDPMKLALAVRDGSRNYISAKQPDMPKLHFGKNTSQYRNFISATYDQLHRNGINGINAMKTKYYRRNMPHYHPEEAIYFITFRLKNSIPHSQSLVFKGLLEKSLLRIEHQNLPFHEKIELINMLRRKNQWLIETYLDKVKSGPKWLAQEKIAEIVKHAIHYQSGDNYRLFAFSIMPNHVHLLIKTITGKQAVSKILQRLKRYSARRSNKQLNRTGSFWQNENYDRVVRSGKFDSTLRYILNNPVKAKLVRHWQDWKWNYCCQELLPRAPH